MKVKSIDVNMKAVYSKNDAVNSKYYANLPTLHMLVLANDYDMMKVFLHAGEQNTREDKNKYNPLKISIFDFKALD